MDELSLPVPSALRKEMSGRLTNAIIQFARVRGLDPKFLWDGVGVDGDFLTDVNAWVSLEVLNILMARLRKQTGDPRIMEQVGLAAPELRAFGFIGVVAFLLKDPTYAAYRLVDEMFDFFTKISTMRVLEFTPQRVIITHQVQTGYPVPKDLCYFARGCIMGFPKTWGLRPAKIVEEACQADGKPACRYLVTWPRVGLRSRVRLWVKTHRLHDRLVRLLVDQNALIETKYEEALRKSQELERAYLRIMVSLMEALDAKDPYTEHHSRTVAAYAVEIAHALGMPQVEVERIRKAALLHDIGKIGVPEQVLLKSGPLNEDEMASVRLHPILGEKILQPLSFLGPIIDMVAQEHERFDGNGYPRGLPGDRIHQGARVISIADALDAMTSDRPYRKALSFEEAAAEIRRCAGSQFDPVVVDAFVQALPRLQVVHKKAQAKPGLRLDRSPSLS